MEIKAERRMQVVHRFTLAQVQELLGS
jgi:hypothetical protein